MRKRTVVLGLSLSLKLLPLLSLYLDWGQALSRELQTSLVEMIMMRKRSPLV